MLVEAGFVKMDRVKDLLVEANELTAIVVSSIKTSRRNGAKSSTTRSR